MQYKPQNTPYPRFIYIFILNILRVCGFMESQTLSHGSWQRIPYLQTLMFSKSMEHISSKFSLPSLHKTKSFLLFFGHLFIKHISSALQLPGGTLSIPGTGGEEGQSLAVFARRAQVSETQRH